jgi:hypothetical protein
MGVSFNQWRIHNGSEIPGFADIDAAGGECRLTLSTNVQKCEMPYPNKPSGVIAMGIYDLTHRQINAACHQMPCAESGLRRQTSESRI